MFQESMSGRLREAWRERGWADATTGQTCPSPDRIWAVVLGEADRMEARHIVQHGVGCAACASALALGREIASGAELAETSATGPSHRWRWVAAAAAAAAVLLAILVVPVWLRLSQRGGTPEYRDESGIAIEALTPENAALPRERFVLRWAPGPPGTLYTIRLAMTDLTIVASTRALETAEWQVPATALAALPAGTALVWSVESLEPDGKRRASPAFRVRLP